MLHFFSFPSSCVILTRAKHLVSSREMPRSSQYDTAVFRMTRLCLDGTDLSSVLQLSMKRDRFPTLEANDVESLVLSKVYAELQQRYVGFDDPAHGWEHIERVYRLALCVAEQ